MRISGPGSQHDAGMKYLVITAKHHDGFCMFKTSTTKYNIVDATPWHQDPLAPLSAACKRHGVRFCCYYSIMDWHSPYQTAAKPDQKNPDYNPTRFSNAEQKEDYRKYMKAELTDLITQYHPGVIWFDGGWINNGWSEQDGRDLVGYLHQLDPQLIVNDRANGSGDFGTPEQSIPAAGLNRDWETCMTINGNWGFSANDQGFKATSELLRNLIDIASKGGNYLLNVGPTAEGIIPQPEVERLKEIGDWLKTNGDALYGTTASPFKKQLAWGRATQKPGKLFLTVFEWPKNGSLLVPVNGKVSKAYLLARPGEALRVDSDPNGLRVMLPAERPDPIASVVALEIEGPKVASFLGPDADGSIRLMATDAKISGSHLALEGSAPGNLGYWIDASDYAAWMFRVAKAGDYTPELSYSASPGYGGSQIELAAGDQKATATLAETAGWADYRPLTLSALHLKAGDVTLTLKATKKPGGAVMNSALDRVETGEVTRLRNARRTSRNRQRPSGEQSRVTCHSDGPRGAAGLAKDLAGIYGRPDPSLRSEAVIFCRVGRVERAPPRFSTQLVGLAASTHPTPCIESERITGSQDDRVSSSSQERHVPGCSRRRAVVPKRSLS